MIYFIACREAGLVKIGYTTGDAAYRLTQLQYASPFELEIMGVASGERAEELRLHKLFQADRFRKEWFKISDQILAYVEEIGGMVHYHRIAKTYLRDMIDRHATKAWSVEQRRGFRDLRQNGLSRGFVRWVEYTGNLSDSDEAKIMAFLSENGLLPASRAAA